MADVARLLETMHPMREPPTPAAITPFLAMLALGCAAAFTIMFVVWQVRRRHTALRTAAEAALAASRGLSPGERLAAQALLLRRLVRNLAGDEASRAQGDAWLKRLDEIFATRFFTQDKGAVFGDSLYRRPSTIDIDALDHELCGFFDRMRPQKVGA